MALSWHLQSGALLWQVGLQRLRCQSRNSKCRPLFRQERLPFKGRTPLWRNDSKISLNLKIVEPCNTLRPNNQLTFLTTLKKITIAHLLLHFQAQSCNNLITNVQGQSNRIIDSYERPTLSVKKKNIRNSILSTSTVDGNLSVISKKKNLALAYKNQDDGSASVPSNQCVKCNRK